MARWILTVPRINKKPKRRQAQKPSPKGKA